MKALIWRGVTILICMTLSAFAQETNEKLRDVFSKWWQAGKAGDQTAFIALLCQADREYAEQKGIPGWDDFRLAAEQSEAVSLSDRISGDQATLLVMIDAETRPFAFVKENGNWRVQLNFAGLAEQNILAVLQMLAGAERECFANTMHYGGIDALQPFLAEPFPGEAFDTTFQIQLTDNGLGYVCHATPVVPTGESRHYFMDASGDVRAHTGGAAGPQDAVVASFGHTGGDPVSIPEFNDVGEKPEQGFGVITDFPTNLLFDDLEKEDLK